MPLKRKSSAQNVEIVESLSNRSEKFSKEEIGILLENVSSQRAILFGSFSNTITKEKKDQIWSQIATNINAVSAVERSIEKIKKKWTDFASRAKCKHLTLRKARAKSGCNDPSDSPELTDLEKLALDISGELAIEGLPDGMDSLGKEEDILETPSDKKKKTDVEMDVTWDNMENDTSHKTSLTSKTTKMSIKGNSANTATSASSTYLSYKKNKSISVSQCSSEKEQQQSDAHNLIEIEKEKLQMQREALEIQREMLFITKKRLAAETKISVQLEHLNTNLHLLIPQQPQPQYTTMQPLDFCNI